MRNFIAHDYDGIDRKLVWDTIAVSLPDLARALAPLAGEPRRRGEAGIDRWRREPPCRARRVAATYHAEDLVPRWWGSGASWAGAEAAAAVVVAVLGSAARAARCFPFGEGGLLLGS